MYITRQYKSIKRAMDTPWWQKESPYIGRRQLYFLFDRIQDEDEAGNTERAIELLESAIPPANLEFPDWAVCSFVDHLRATYRPQSDIRMQNKIIDAARRIRIVRDGQDTPLISRFGLVLSRDNLATDAALSQMVDMHLDLSRDEKTLISRNRETWPRAYDALAQPWSLQLHSRLPPSEKEVIFTVLLCARRLVPRLPPEIWLLIFEQLRRIDL